MARIGRGVPIKAHINLQGRLGVYFNYQYLTGTVRLNGVAVSGAIVRIIRQSTDQEIDKTTTDGSGIYTFKNVSGGLLPGENYHIAVEYTDGSLVKYNAKSLWNVQPVIST